MKMNSTAKTRIIPAYKYYDQIAAGYEQLYKQEQLQKMNIIKQNMQILPHTKIIDIGCGSGLSTQFDCTCIGIDPSKKLIQLAKKQDPNIKHTYYVKKAEQLPTLKFKDNEFDYAICLSAYHHITSRVRFLKELKRITKKAIITLLHSSSQKEAMRQEIATVFTIKKEIVEKKDLILIVEK